MNKAIVIINPASGSSDDDFRALVESELKDRGAEYELFETDPEKGGEEIAHRAVANGATHLLACGGDGTVMSIVNGIGKELEAEGDLPEPDSGVVLSIIPGGTANLLASALGIPFDTKEAIATAVAGEDRWIDLGRCGEHLFALGVGVGLTERLVSKASAEEKEKIGKLAYVKAMLQEMGVRPHTFTFKLDGKAEQKARGVAIVIANAGQIGANVHFAPDAEMDDGLIDLCILHRFYFRDVVRMGLRTLFGNLPDDRAVSFFQAKKIEITSDPPLDSQVEGEVVEMTTPLVARVLPRALLVRVPKKAKEKAEEEALEKAEEKAEEEREEELSGEKNRNNAS